MDAMHNDEHDEPPRNLDEIAMTKKDKCRLLEWLKLVPIKDDKGFRLANMFVLLTYKTHLCKPEMSTYFRSDPFRCMCVNVSNENGSRLLPYKHTHIVLRWEEPYTTTNCRVFDYKVKGEVIHPNIRVLSYKKAYHDALKYITKEDGAAWIEEEEAQNIFDDCVGLSTVECLQKCKKFSEVPGAIALSAFTSKSEIPLPEIELESWQKAILSLMKRPSDRKVYWLCDPVGGCGKSTFARWMYAKHQKKNRKYDVLVLSQLGGAKDAATIIQGALQRGWTQKMLILDLSRAAEHKSIYEPIEQIKNGQMNTLKYHGEEVWFNCPHVVVLANFAPDKGQLSEDRWSIWYYRGHDKQFEKLP